MYSSNQISWFQVYVTPFNLLITLNDRKELEIKKVLFKWMILSSIVLYELQKLNIIIVFQYISLSFVFL